MILINLRKETTAPKDKFLAELYLQSKGRLCFDEKYNLTLNNPTSMLTETIFHYTPYSLSELAKLYQINPKTFRKWIARIQHKIGDRIGRCYSVVQVRVITDHFGLPFKIIVD